LDCLPSVSIVASLAGDCFIQIGDRELTQGPAVAKELLRKVLHVPAPGPKGLCGESLLHSQVIGEFFFQGLIDRKRLRSRAETFQETQPVDRTGKEIFTALLAIYVIRVPEPRPERPVHCDLDGFNTDGF
jgi:hypothetical protein